MFTRFWNWITGSGQPVAAAAVTVKVDDSPGWAGLRPGGHDYDQGTIQELYSDALTAWRKNPIAWRIIAIVTDYVVGDQILINSPDRNLAKFIDSFWYHQQNTMGMRLEQLCDELARSGDLFCVLFRNPEDGMSYFRLVTKDRIKTIQTAENDWERELYYVETRADGSEHTWPSPYAPDAASSPAVMLHYAVNRPAGALMGESDLTTMLPWLQRYSRMLEDRVRLNWAMRSFLWLITVPTNMIAAKREQYRNPPETGSLIIKDTSESWEPIAPDLKAIDAKFDLQAVRLMIDAGSGFPPHWRGEAGDANLATAQAMQGPTERHLLRRQKYFVFVLQDIVYQAYLRAAELGKYPKLRENEYAKLFQVKLPEISRWDNESLARASRDITRSLTQVKESLGGRSRILDQHLVRLAMLYANEPLNEQEIQDIIKEVENDKEARKTNENESNNSAS